MDITITASEAFLRFLEKEGELSITNTEAKTIQDTYEANLTDILINASMSAVISIFSPFITDAIKDYVETTHETIYITTENEKYIINTENADTMLPILNQEIIAILNEESNVKNRPI